MIKIIHVGDNHIGAILKSASYTKDSLLKRQIEIINTLYKLVDFANEKEVDYILISGDLFDAKNIKMSIIKNVFRKLGKFNGRVLIIAGNHDHIAPSSFWTTLEMDDNIYLFKPGISKYEFNEDNIVFYGHSWDRSHIRDYELNNIEKLDSNKINILLAHGDIFNKTSEYLPIDKNIIEEKGFDYIALGHIHKHEFITPKIAYSGSLEPLDFGETGDHGFIYLEFNNKELSTKFIPFASRKFIIKEYNLTSDLTNVDVSNYISSIDSLLNKANNYYRVIFKGRYNHQLNLDEEHLHQSLKNEFEYIEFINQASLDFDIKQLKIDNKDNVIGLYIEKFEQLDLNDETTKTAFELGLGFLLDSKEGSL